MLDTSSIPSLKSILKLVPTAGTTDNEFQNLSLSQSTVIENYFVALVRNTFLIAINDFQDIHIKRTTIKHIILHMAMYDIFLSEILTVMYGRAGCK